VARASPDATHLDPYAVNVDFDGGERKKLAARIGVTESTVIETRLDPASFDCTPSIGAMPRSGDNEAASLTIISNLSRGNTNSTRTQGRKGDRSHAPMISPRSGAYGRAAAGACRVPLTTNLRRAEGRSRIPAGADRDRRQARPFAASAAFFKVRPIRVGCCPEEAGLFLQKRP